MSEADQVRIDEELVAAKAARAAASNRIAELQSQQREMRPVWRRLTARQVDDSLGEEYDLVPRRWGTA